MEVIRPFGFSYIREDLQDEVGDDCAGQVPFFLPCIKERHVQYNNVRVDILCDVPPLFNNFRIIAPETVDALYKNRISCFQLFEETLILLAIKILAGLFIKKDIARGYPAFRQGDKLAVLALSFRGNPPVSVDFFVFL